MRWVFGAAFVCAGVIVAAVASDADPVDFGFVSGNLYTFGYQCNAPGAPAQLAGQGTTGRINYLLINRFDL